MRATSVSTTLIYHPCAVMNTTNAEVTVVVTKFRPEPNNIQQMVRTTNFGVGFMKLMVLVTWGVGARKPRKGKTACKGGETVQVEWHMQELGCAGSVE